MNFTPKYNAKGLKQYLKKNPNSKLNCIDALLLNEIDYLIKTWTHINTLKINAKTFYNIAYKKLLRQLPHIGINTKESLAKRLKRGLINEKLILKFIDENDNSKVYFRITELGYKFLGTGLNIHGGNENKFGRVTKLNSTNKNINNKNINNKREYSHFEFLKVTFPKEIDRIIMNYPLPQKELEYCINEFNSKNYNKPNSMHFERYINKWYDNIRNYNTTPQRATPASQINFS